MNTKKSGKALFFTAALVLALGLFCPPAEALTLDGAVGTWSNTVIASGDTTYLAENLFVDGERQVRWGQPAGSGQSGLGFTGAAPPIMSFDIGDVFEIGQLVHYNQPIYAGSEATSTQLSIGLNFSDPALIANFDFVFEVNETPNAYGDSRDDDIISFADSFAPQTFNIGGIDYTLELLGFGFAPESILNEFSSPENGNNAINLYGRITSAGAPVPEPGTLLLLGCGLLGLFGYRRFAKK